MVALHEIGHVRNGHVRPAYYGEYLAEKFALERAAEMGIDPGMYTKRAKCYVLMNLAKAHNRGLDHKNIPDAVREFIDMDISNWIGRRVFVTYNKKTGFVPIVMFPVETAPLQTK